MSAFRITLTLVLVGAVTLLTEARNDPNKSSGQGRLSGVAAGCSPPVGSIELDLNNVRTTIQTGGDMWWDLDDAKYEVPKGSGKHSIFSGSLWMGGVDVNNQLKVAALAFRAQGFDFWPGPLSTDLAEVDAGTCDSYDRFFQITRSQVNQFVAWYNCANLDPDCEVGTEFPGYVIPAEILNWPAHGDPTKNQDFNLAPFFDADGSGDYNPEDGGDFPYYDLTANPNCNTEREVKLFGDETLWWVFNDKGNIHTETGASPIGMEVRAQAFAFATNDEINDMTFMNYELINRGSFTLTNTYFAPWVDPDLGNFEDDYVGCDVERGLGYCYNGDALDGVTGSGPTEYPDNPPAIGVDFFQGPYQDDDGRDNIGPAVDSTGVLITPSYSEANSDNGIVYKGIGIGYGDGIIDNERYGMRKFVYFSNASVSPPPPNYATDPDEGSEYYNYMNGIWRDGTPLCYGGNGHPDGGCTGVPADYMFPGDSDPLGWSTGGVPQPEWTEATNNNAEGDRRFLQSAGPFTLDPGAVNDITIGVVWAWDAGGSQPFESVEKMRLADDKAQALFDNCFVLIDGPDAPDVDIVELDRELVLVLSNSSISNNENGSYAQADPFIVSPDSVVYDNVYRFEGYQVFQLKDQSVSVSDLNNPDLARLVAQCDKKNFKDNGEPIDQLVNFTYSEELGANIPEEMVNGENEGIRYTFRIVNDEFASGDRRLVNHKTYYYMAIAYAFNEYKEFDATDPLLLDGQKLPYLAGRKTATGASISAVTGIPHIEGPEAGGTILNSSYGDGPPLTRLEGQGNGGREVFLTSETIQKILDSDASRLEQITYQGGLGPIEVKVYDPFNVPNAEFEIKIVDDVAPIGEDLEDAYWKLTCISGDCPINSNGDVMEWVSNQPLGMQAGTEQIIEEIGLSVYVEQTVDPGEEGNVTTPVNANGYISATATYAHPPFWLTGISDLDGSTTQDWIKAGTAVRVDADGNDVPTDFPGYDDGQIYEGLLNGTVSPYRLARDFSDDTVNYPGAPAWQSFRTQTRMEHLAGVDIVITSDEALWSRVPVIEVGNENLFLEGGAKSHELRMSPSVGKDGTPDGELDANGNPKMGMGWFPGYAINVETGERLNMAFGESSWLRDQNGADMIWNPTSELYDDVFNFNEGWFNTLFGGMHYVYVFGNNDEDEDFMPNYDAGEFIFTKLLGEDGDYDPQPNSIRKVWQDCMWVLAPLLEQDARLLGSDLTINLRVTKPFREDFAPGWTNSAPENNNLPRYSFSTSELAAVRGDLPTAEDALKEIRMVPNPYYAASGYEATQLDNIVKIINLPEVCDISIYTVNGVLVRSYSKASPITSIDWDLKNHADIPVGSGMYIVHVNAPGIGERILKWFGSVRQLDLNSF